MDLQTWMENNPISPEMIWKETACEQVRFMSHIIAPMCNKDGAIEVISSHRSKSIRLPVYEIVIKDKVRFTVRNNFYDWKVSVEPLINFEVDFQDLFDQDKEISDCYCEGFPESRVFGSYSKSQIPGNIRAFTVELSNEYKVYTLFWLITRYLNVITGW